jgi:hypothetical protein
MKNSISDRLAKLEAKAPKTFPDSEVVLELLPPNGEEPSEIPYFEVGHRGGVFVFEENVRPTTPEDIAGWKAVWEGKPQ